MAKRVIEEERWTARRVHAADGSHHDCRLAVAVSFHQVALARQAHGVSGYHDERVRLGR
jgi:hypothetical protein